MTPSILSHQAIFFHRHWGGYRAGVRAPGALGRLSLWCLVKGSLWGWGGGDWRGLRSPSATFLCNHPCSPASSGLYWTVSPQGEAAWHRARSFPFACHSEPPSGTRRLGTLWENCQAQSEAFLLRALLPTTFLLALWQRRGASGAS